MVGVGDGRLVMVGGVGGIWLVEVAGISDTTFLCAQNEAYYFELRL